MHLSTSMPTKPITLPCSIPKDPDDPTYPATSIARRCEYTHGLYAEDSFWFGSYSAFRPRIVQRWRPCEYHKRYIRVPPVLIQQSLLTHRYTAYSISIKHQWDHRAVKLKYTNAPERALLGITKQPMDSILDHHRIIIAITRVTFRQQKAHVKAIQ